MDTVKRKAHKAREAWRKRMMSELYARWGRLPLIAVWKIAALMQGKDPDNLQDVVINDQGDGVDLSYETGMLISAIQVGELTTYPLVIVSPSDRTEIEVKALVPWLRIRRYYDLADGLTLPTIGVSTVVNVASLAAVVNERETVSPDNLQTPIKAAFSLTRSAMVAQHQHEWPTIEADIKAASENGLSACKAGKRDWRERDALEWARSKGKLIKQPETAGLTHSMRSLPGKIHKMAN